MTIAPVNPSNAELTEHDHIVGSDEHDTRMDSFDLPCSLGVHFHIQAQTPVRVRVHESENRAVVRLGGFNAAVDVFANVEQIDRLITVLTVARNRLR